MLTIAHVSTQRGWHGGEEQARLLCEGLRQRGHRNLIAARQGGEFASRMGGAGFDVHPIIGSGRGPAAIFGLRRLFKKSRPEVVHFHDSHALSGGGVASWGLSIPARVAARRVDFPIKSIWRYRHLVDRVIAVSHAVADVCRAGGVPPDKIRVVHDGVDPQRAASGNRERGRAALKIGADSFLLLTVATLTDHKGHKFLLQALPAVLKRQPRVVAAFAGDGELRDELIAESRRLGIEQHVKFLGYRNDIPDLLHAADLFVLPSHMEGLCSTLIDVMFARTPIVATTAGGIPDLVGTRDNQPPVGILVPPKDVSALTEAILQALAKEPVRATMVAQAYDRACAQFTADQMVLGTLAIYRERLPTALAALG